MIEKILEESWAEFKNIDTSLEEEIVVEGFNLRKFDDMIVKARDLSHSEAINDLHFQVHTILHHNLFPPPRPSPYASLRLEIDPLTCYLESAEAILAKPGVDLSFTSDGVFLEGFIWQLEDFVGYLKEREGLREEMQRIIGEEPLLRIDVAIADLPTRKIDASILGDKQGYTECYVCKDEASLEEIVTVPANCKHWVHAECLRTWAMTSTIEHISRHGDVNGEFEVVVDCYCSNAVFPRQAGLRWRR